MATVSDRFGGDEFFDRLKKALEELLPAALRDALQSAQARSFTGRARNASFTPAEFAGEVGVKETTVTYWCREGMINAKKTDTKSGDVERWTIAIEEYDRYKRDLLLPRDPDRNYPNGRPPKRERKKKD